MNKLSIINRLMKTLSISNQPKNIVTSPTHSNNYYYTGSAYSSSASVSREWIDEQERLRKMEHRNDSIKLILDEVEKHELTMYI